MPVTSWPEEQVSDDDADEQCQRVHDHEQAQPPDREEVKEDLFSLCGQADLCEFSFEEDPQDTLDEKDECTPAEDGEQDTHCEFVF